MKLFSEYVLLDVISILPFEPLMKLLSPPKKNRDELNEELQTLLSASSVPFFTDILLPDDGTGVRSIAGKKDRVADAEAKRSDTAEAVAVRTRRNAGRRASA